MRSRSAVIAVLAVLAVAALAAGFFLKYRRDSFLALLAPVVPQPQAVFHKNHILVLVEGLDYDYNSQDEEYSSKARSDVIKAINLDFLNHNVYVVDIPRDMDAILPNGRETKINEAQSEGGVSEARSVIAGWLGIPGFDRYVILRVNTTKDLINAIGGVDVKVMNSDCLMHPPGCVNGPLDYVDTWGHLSIHLKPGFQHLNGDQAVGYSRFRHDWCGDPCRIMRQDQVLNAMVAKLRTNQINTLLHLNDLLAVFRRDVQTDLTNQEQLSLAFSFAALPKGGLHTAQIPYVDDKVASDGGEVIIPDQTKKAQLVQSYLLSVPQPSPPPAQAVRVAGAPTPSQVRVVVENGTGVPGVARRAAELLRERGFTIAQIGNAPAANFTTTQVHERSGAPNAAAKVRDALGSAASKALVIADAGSFASEGPGSDVTVVVGQDLVPYLTAQPISNP